MTDYYQTGTKSPNLIGSPETVTIHEYDLDLEVSGHFDLKEFTIDGMDVFHSGDSIYSLLSEDQVLRIERLAIEERRK